MPTNISLIIFLAIFSLFSGLTGLNAAVVTITTADGAGADARTSSGAPDTNFDSDDRIQLDRDNTKSYLKFDLSVIPSLDTITEVTFTIEQIPSYGPKDIELFGINLDYDFVGEGRLSATDWSETAITHNNAPASGAGGSVSTSGSRSILFEELTADLTNQFYTYTESSTDASTPLLDYLNGTSGFSDGTNSLIRSFIIAEGPNSNRTTEIYGSKETGDGIIPPTLELTYTPVPESSQFALLSGMAAFVLLWIRSRRSRG